MMMMMMMIHREVMENRPDIIKNKRRENMHTGKCNKTNGQKCHAKGRRKETVIEEFMHRDTTNVRHEMYDCTGNNWSHRSSNKGFKEKFGSRTRKTFSRFTTKDSCTWNITHNAESIAV
jgi:hypothetical protein